MEIGFIVGLWSCQAFDSAVSDHAAVGVRYHDNIATLCCFLSDGGARRVNVVFEGCIGIAACRGEGNGNAFESVGFLQGLDDLAVAVGTVPGTVYED